MPGERGISGPSGPKGDGVSYRTGLGTEEILSGARCLLLKEDEPEPLISSHRVLLETKVWRVKPDLMVPG